MKNPVRSTAASSVRAFLSLLALMAATGAELPANATVYPARAGQSTAVAIVESAGIDTEVRVQLIRRARSVEILNFTQSAGWDTGPHIALALREAVRHGARVTTFSDQAGTAIFGAGDLLHQLTGRDELTELLADPKLSPAGNFPELRKLSFRTKRALGLLFDDFFHEKIMILNRGASDEVVIVSSAPVAESTGNSETTAYLRATTPGTAYAGDDVKAYADRVLEFARQHADLATPAAPSPKLAQKLRARMRPLVTRAQDARLRDQMFEWATLPAARLGDSGFPFAFVPEQVQLLSNDMIFQLVDRFSFSTPAARRSLIQKSTQAEPGEIRSDTLVAIAKDVANSEGGMIVSFAVAYPSLLEKALVQGLENGSDWRIYTNSEASLNKAGPLIGDAAGQMTAENLLRISRNADHGRSVGKLDVFELDYPVARKLRDAEPLSASVYLHRKQMILRMGPQKVTYLGSDNFTESSSTQCSDIMLRIDSVPLADYLDSQMQKDAERFYKPLAMDELRRRVEELSVARVMDFFLRGVARRLY